MDDHHPWAVYAALVSKPSDVSESLWKRVAEAEDRRDAEGKAVMHEIKNPSQWAFAGINVGPEIRCKP